jgi:hypothetical protein
MKLFPEESNFVVGEVGFDGDDTKGRKYDLLNRKPFGQKLTKLVDRFEQPVVIALDGSWGSGKSHFLKLWAGAHSKELNGKAELIYFDAFEHDFLDDPLVSLVSRLVVLGEAKSWSDKALTKVKKSAMPLVNGVLRAGLAFATAGISEATGPVLDAVIGKVGDLTEDQISDFWTQETGRIAAMVQFKAALVALTASEGSAGNPRKLVFIIDELDRCRPDYALSLLEIVKHFFAVPNVHFVLGVNLNALHHSVKARYGNDFDAQLYLQKFIQLVVKLPDQKDDRLQLPWETYFRAITFDMGIHHEVSLASINQIQLIALSRTVSLRDVQRVASRLTLLPVKFPDFSHGQIMIGISAVLFQVFRPDILMEIKEKNAPWGPELFKEIQKLFTLNAEVAGKEILANTLSNFWKMSLGQELGAQVDRQQISKWLNGETWGGRLEFDLKPFIADTIETFHLPELPSSQ